MPRLNAHIMYIAANHFLRDIFEPSKMVPTVTVNCRLQALHLYRDLILFLVLDLRVMRYGSVAPHFGHTGPLGHLMCSRYVRQSFSVHRKRLLYDTLCLAIPAYVALIAI
jgi:hypothetical protein